MLKAGVFFIHQPASLEQGKDQIHLCCLNNCLITLYIKELFAKLRDAGIRENLN
jgi:hypothetical protein